MARLQPSTKFETSCPTSETVLSAHFWGHIGPYRPIGTPTRTSTTQNGQPAQPAHRAGQCDQIQRGWRCCSWWFALFQRARLRCDSCSSTQGHHAAAAMAKEWVLQPDFSSPKIPPGTAENLLASGSSAHPTFSPSEYPTSAQRFFGRRQLRAMHGQDPDCYTPVPAGHWARPGPSPDWSGKKPKKPKPN